MWTLEHHLALATGSAGAWVAAGVCETTVGAAVAAVVQAETASMSRVTIADIRKGFDRITCLLIDLENGLKGSKTKIGQVRVPILLPFLSAAGKNPG
jgi:hypothetical protein